MDLRQKVEFFKVIIAQTSPGINVHDLPNAPLNKEEFKAALLAFAAKLDEFQAEPGQSVDEALLHNCSFNLNSAATTGNLDLALKELRTVIDNTQDGGKDLYDQALTLYNTARALQSVRPKASSPPSWLSSYITKQKPNSWLDNYMGQEKAKEEADADIAGMTNSLNSGSSIKVPNV